MTFKKSRDEAASNYVRAVYGEPHSSQKQKCFIGTSLGFDLGAKYILEHEAVKRLYVQVLGELIFNQDSKTLREICEQFTKLKAEIE